jgi:hypothetical protein
VKNNFEKQLRKHEFYAAANGALLVMIAMAAIYGQKILHFLPPEEDFNRFRYMVYGIWAAHVAGLAIIQKVLMNSRKKLAAFSSPNPLA